MAKNAEKVQTALADANAVAQETLGSMRTVFSFANEDQVCGSVKNVAMPRILSFANECPVHTVLLLQLYTVSMLTASFGSIVCQGASAAA